MTKLQGDKGFKAGKPHHIGNSAGGQNTTITQSWHRSWPLVGLSPSTRQAAIRYKGSCFCFQQTSHLHWQSPPPCPLFACASFKLSFLALDHRTQLEPAPVIYQDLGPRCLSYMSTAGSCRRSCGSGDTSCSTWAKAARRRSLTFDRPSLTAASRGIRVRGRRSRPPRPLPCPATATATRAANSGPMPRSRRSTKAPTAAKAYLTGSTTRPSS